MRIIGIWTIPTIMANVPCLRSFFRLISTPMQNIIMINPMSARMLMMNSDSSVTSHTVVRIIPAER